MPTPDQHPAAELEPLAPLTGRWASEGRTVATEDEPSVRIIGTDVYEWMSGGYFLVHRVHVRMGETVVEVLEVIGEFDGTGYTMRSFDRSGAAGLMRATVADDGVMTFAGDGMRTTLEIAADGESMSARWEREGRDGTWAHWMDMHFTRI